MSTSHSVRATVFALGVPLTVLLAATPAWAIINGQPDGNDHPYVGVVLDETTFCSGSLISPTIFVTAAHCFEDPGQPVFLSFDPEGPDLADFPDNLLTGHWFPDPEFCLACAPGLPSFNTHDVAVVVLDEPVILDRYAQLPTEGFVDTLPKKTQVESVGYGDREPPKDLEDEFLIRFVAISNLFPLQGPFGEEFLKLSANHAQGKGGTCFGDSGGPNLLAGTDTILGITSFLQNECLGGVTYSYRLDTEEALAFINSFLD